jgi:GT2 family glycosyltransferase
MVSVITLTWNSEKYIETCVQSLLTDAKESDIETRIIVVDNGSKDRTLDILDRLETESPIVDVIKLQKNLGTSISRNLGIQKSEGKYVFIIDSDTEVKPGTMKILTEIIQNGNRIGIAAPRLVYPDGSVQPSCKKFPTAKTKFLKLLPIKKLRKNAFQDELYPPEVYDTKFDQIMNVDSCIAAAWMVDREAIEDIGLLDEKIFYAPEDVDFCLRMWLGGWRVVYAPKANVIHHTQRESYKKPGVAFRHIGGLLYYFRKHGYWLNREKIYKKLDQRLLS